MHMITFGKCTVKKYKKMHEHLMCLTQHIKENTFRGCISTRHAIIQHTWIFCELIYHSYDPAWGPTE